jgi:hypothetical protein
MTKPRYVQGIGGVHVLPGTPPALAALQTMGGSSGDPIRDALLYGGPGAAQLEGGRLAADTTLRRQAMQNAADIQRAQILAAATANPAGATPAAPGGGGIIGTSAPPPTDAEFGLTPQQIAGLRARQGDDVALDAYIRTLKLEPWQARKLKEQYRQTFGQQIWGGISDFWRGPYSTAMPNELK